MQNGLWNTHSWEVVVGVHRPPHLIVTPFQSNIYKVNVREFLPRDRTDCLLKTSGSPQLTFGSPIWSGITPYHTDANLYLNNNEAASLQKYSWFVGILLTLFSLRCNVNGREGVEFCLIFAICLNLKSDLIGDLEDWVVICHAVWEQRHLMSGPCMNLYLTLKVND